MPSSALQVEISSLIVSTSFVFTLEIPWLASPARTSSQFHSSPTESRTVSGKIRDKCTCTGTGDNKSMYDLVSIFQLNGPFSYVVPRCCLIDSALVEIHLRFICPLYTVTFFKIINLPEILQQHLGVCLTWAQVLPCSQFFNPNTAVVNPRYKRSH